MANWGAFSRDFVGGFKVGADVVMRADENARRAELAQKAEARAQGRYDQEAADRAAAEAATAAEFNGSSVAAKAAPKPASAIPAPPNKLGAVTSTGEPVPVDPAGQEVADVAEARSKGFEPAPPAAIPAPRSAPAAQPAEPDAGSIPQGLLDLAAKGNKTAAARVRELRTQALEQRNKDRDFNERKRITDDTLETTALNRQTVKQSLDQETYEAAKVKAQDFSKQAFSVADSLRGKEQLRVSDPSVAPAVAQLTDALKQGYDATPDGRTISVKQTPAGIMVTTIDEETGKPVGPPDMFATVGDLQKATIMFGQMTQGDKLGDWIASTSAQALANKARGTEGAAAVNSTLDKIINATPEERLTPEWQAKTKEEITKLTAQYPDIANEVVERQMKDPTTGEPLFDPESNKPVMEKVKENRFAKIADLMQPNTKVKTPKGELDATVVIGNFLQDPTPALKAAGGDPQQAIVMLRDKLVKSGLDAGIADVLVQQAMVNLPKALEQSLAISAMPQSAIQARNMNFDAVGPARGGVRDSATPAGAPGPAQAVGGIPARPAGPPLEGQRAFEPGAPDTRLRRPVPPVQVNPQARQIGSPYSR